MRRIARLGAAALLLAAGCGSDGGEATADTGQDVYFGYVFGREEITAVAIDASAPGEGGTRGVRSYVCDGLGQPDGLAVWFLGEVVPEDLAGVGTTTAITSASGNETLQIGTFVDEEVTGVFTAADGTESRFIASRAIDGAGIYEVTVSEDGGYTGTSTDGSTVEAEIAGQFVEGTITTAGGASIPFRQQSLALASPAELADYGLSDRASDFADVNQLPGEYVAVVSPAGSHWFGRSGNVRGGQSGNNIIGLDKSH